MTTGMLHSDQVLCAATLDRLAIAVWHGEPTLRHMDILEDMVRERVRLYSKAILLIIIEAPVLPAEASRKRMSQVMDRYKSALSAIAVVIEVGGLFGTALRALGRGVVVASGARTPTAFASTVDEAIETLYSALADAELDAQQVASAVLNFRKRYASSMPPPPPSLS
jgi:hypothetical protein